MSRVTSARRDRGRAGPARRGQRRPRAARRVGGALPPPAMRHPLLGGPVSGVSGRVETIVDKGLADENPWVRAAVRMFRANVAENAGDVERMRSDCAIALRAVRDDRRPLGPGVRAFGPLAGADPRRRPGRRHRLDEPPSCWTTSRRAPTRRRRSSGSRVCNAPGRLDEARRRRELVAGAPAGSGRCFTRPWSRAWPLAERDPVAMRGVRERLRRSEVGTTPAQLQGHATRVGPRRSRVLQAEDATSRAALGSLRSAYPIAVPPRTCPSWPRTASRPLGWRGARPTRGQCGAARRGCAACAGARTSTD